MVNTMAHVFSENKLLLFTSLIGLIIFFPTAHCMHCLQCDSELDPLCRSGYIPSTRCAEPDAIGCITYVGKMPYPEPNYVMRECATKKKRDFCHKVPAIPGFMSEHELCLKTCYHSECNYEPVDDKLSHFVRRMLHLQPVAENAVHTY